MTTGIRWLESLPLPERDNFGDTFEEVRRRSPMEIGPVRQRRMRRASPRLFNVTFRLNQQQYTEYDLWFQNDIQGGALPFDIQLLDDDQTYVWYTCYWVSPPTTAVIGSNADMWSVVGVLRARDQSFATRLPGTNELRGSAFVGVDGSAEIVVETALYGLATVGINNANGRLPNAHMYGLAQVGISNFGLFLREYFQGAAHIGVTASARLTTITDTLYGKATVGVTGTGTIYNDKSLRGIANVGVSNTGLIPDLSADPLFAHVSLLLYFEGTNGATTTVDSSSSPHTMTMTSATLSNSHSKFGTTGLLVTTGTSGSAHLTAVTSPADNLQLGTSEWDLGMWVYPTSAASSYLYNSSSTNTTSPITIIYNSSGFILCEITGTTGSAQILTSDAALTLNAWSFLQVRRRNGVGGGDRFDFAINGTLQSQVLTATSGIILFATAAITIGGTGGISLPFPGIVGETRLTVGSSRTIAVPTVSFPNH